MRKSTTPKHVIKSRLPIICKRDYLIAILVRIGCFQRDQQQNCDSNSYYHHVTVGNILAFVQALIMEKSLFTVAKKIRACSVVFKLSVIFKSRKWNQQRTL